MHPALQLKQEKSILKLNSQIIKKDVKINTG